MENEEFQSLKRYAQKKQKKILSTSILDLVKQATFEKKISVQQ